MKRPGESVRAVVHRGKREKPFVALGARCPVLLLFVLVAGCGGGEQRHQETVVAEAGELTVETRLRPDPPRQRGNTLELVVRDAAGAPVDGATVDVTAHMAEMAGMPAMRSRAAVTPLGGGSYQAKLDVPMSGTWRLEVEVAGDAGGGRAEISFTTGVRGLTVRGGSARPQAGEAPSGRERGEVVIDSTRRQAIGVRTGVVRRRALTLTVRAPGKVAFDQARQSEITAKYGGWIGELMVNAVGQRVRRGQALFTLYSPELLAAQEELLAVLRSQQAARATSAPDRADELVRAARQRLALWDLDPRQLDEIEGSGQPLRYLPVVSVVEGQVIEKMVVAGAAVSPGMVLYRVASLDRVWVEADVFEGELALVSVGQPARITLPYLPGRTFVGAVAFVYPHLDEAARTGRVRIELANRDRELKPGMFAEVVLESARGERLMVPESAVLFAGTQRLVFRDRGEGRLEPRPVVVGVAAGGELEVLSGLEDGDLVVTSGTFLVAAESRLRSGLAQWEEPR